MRMCALNYISQVHKLINNHIFHLHNCWLNKVSNNRLHNLKCDLNSINPNTRYLISKIIRRFFNNFNFYNRFNKLYNKWLLQCNNTNSLTKDLKSQLLTNFLSPSFVRNKSLLSRRFRRR